MDAERMCRGCGEAKPLSAFARDSARPDGYRYRCRPCHAREQRERRAAARADRPRPGALVLTPSFPAPPPEEEAVTPVTAAPASGPVQTHAAAIEEALGKLQPPPGPADAPLVAMVRDLARIMDAGLDPRDRVTVQGRAIGILRELKATRASAVEAVKPTAQPTRLTAY